MKTTKTATEAARTIAQELGQNPDSKGTARLAADLGAKPTATLVNTRMEVPSPRNGRPSYRWVDGCYVVRPDGTKEFPPVRIREAWSRCASEGWAFKVVSESEYKEQTVTTKHTPGPWNANYREQTGWTADIPNGDRLKTTEANARLIAAELGQNPEHPGTKRLAEALSSTPATLTKSQEEYIARAAAFFNAGGNDWQGGDGWGFWFSNGTMSFGASSWCCKNAHAQTIARCRGDAINALRRLYIAGKNKELGAECVIV